MLMCNINNIKRFVDSFTRMNNVNEIRFEIYKVLLIIV